MDFPGRIELTNEVCKIIEFCPRIVEQISSDECEKYCPLSGACLEYWTGDDTANK